MSLPGTLGRLISRGRSAIMRRARQLAEMRRARCGKVGVPGPQGRRSGHVRAAAAPEGWELWQAARWLAAAVACLGQPDVAAGEVAARAARPPVRAMLEIRREHVVVQEWDLSCGAAALTTLLRYQHGADITEKEVAKRLIGRQEYLGDPDRLRMQQGFSLLDLKRVADQLGYLGVGFGQLGLDDLIQKAPVIVPVDFFGYSHFVIFRGRLADRVLLADPAYGNRTMAVGRFLSGWIEYRDIEKVGFVVEARGGIVAPNLLAAEADDFPLLQ